jgi:hypothetical protein
MAPAELCDGVWLVLPSESPGRETRIVPCCNGKLRYTLLIAMNGKGAIEVHTRLFAL